MSQIKPKAKKAVNTAKVSSGEKPELRLDAIAAFAVVARGYCDWCEQQHKGRNPGITAAQWLSRLNDAALGLPKVSWRESLPDAPRLRDLPPRQKGKRTHLRMFAWYYRKVFDPNPAETEEPLFNSVLDDLGDVYSDLAAGLATFEAGYPLQACQHWKASYENHWGMHATGALVALYFKNQRPTGQWPAAPTATKSHTGAPVVGSGAG